MKRVYKNIELCLYDSFEEYQQAAGIEFGFEDNKGNTYDLSEVEMLPMSKEHFSDEEFKEDHLYWEVWNDPDEPFEIVAVILGELKHIEFKEILSLCAHEHGHITDASKYKNSDMPYDTKIGFEQEETKAIAFQTFVNDSYEMAKLFVEMFTEKKIPIKYEH